MVTKNDAVKALETLDGIIDSLDWSGVFIDDELNDIEKSMALSFSSLLNRRKSK